MGKSTIKRQFQIAILSHQHVPGSLGILTIAGYPTSMSLENVSLWLHVQKQRQSVGEEIAAKAGGRQTVLAIRVNMGITMVIPFISWDVR